MTEAIDQLDADRKSTDPSRLEARVAAIWAMVGEIDPELARLVSGYANPGEGQRRRPAGPVAGKPTGYPSLGLAGDEYPADEPE